MNITILGGGNGAFATAADLSSQGHDVTIYVTEAYKKHVEGIKESLEIRCIGDGPNGTFPIKNVTHDLKEALHRADLILPVSTAYAQESMAKELVPYIQPGDRIILTPGSTGGALVYAKIFHEAGKLEGIKLAEMHTLPYAARKVDETTVNILHMCGLLYFAAFPARYNRELYDLTKELFPAVTLVNDVLESSLNNGNASSHPAPVVLNAGKIEYYDKHYHYREGITPSVAHVVEAIDDERKDICGAFGYKETGIIERLHKMGYGTHEETLYETYQSSTDIFLQIEGPNDLSGRYLTEDAPCSLVAMAEIGRAVGVQTPLMDSIIHLASVLRSESYWETGRTLEDMGLGGMNKEQMLDFVRNGYPEQREE